MGWHRRGGNKTYYYKTRRVGDRVVTTYVGGSAVANLIAAQDATERFRRLAELEAARAEDQAAKVADRQYREWSRRVDTLCRGALATAGYHYDRGVWRKRAMAGTMLQTRRPARKSPPLPADDIEALAERAHAGDGRALSRLRTVLADDPGRFIAYGGDLAACALSAAISASCRQGQGHNEFMREALYMKVEQIRIDLAGPNPSPVERLLVERVALCWIRVHEIEIISHHASLSDSQRSRLERRLGRAHGWYLSALRSLASVRRVVPALQINVAEQQVIGDVHRTG